MAEKYFTKNGEWASFDGSLWRVGLTASTAKELGEVTFVELPATNRSVAAGEAVCALEAVKAATDFYCPLEGRIAAVNDRLNAQPELVNSSPEDEGWLFALDSVAEKSLASLLDEQAWKAWENGH